MKIAREVKTQFESLRHFKKKIMKKYPGFISWWKIAARHSARLPLLALKNKEVRESTLDLLKSIPQLAERPDEKIPDDLLKKAEVILKNLERSKNRLTRKDARKCLKLLQAVERKSLNETLQFLNEVKPTQRRLDHII